jgi:hypothetical protein
MVGAAGWFAREKKVESTIVRVESRHLVAEISYAAGEAEPRRGQCFAGRFNPSCGERSIHCGDGSTRRRNRTIQNGILPYRMGE